MTTQIVYTLVSSPEDYYLEQALLSAYSLRLHNPEATVLLLTDDRTAQSLTDSRARIRDYVTRVQSVTLPPEMTNMERSRYLKTNVRDLVEGDYLYIDCDTCICCSLADADGFTCEVGMVADLNQPLAAEPYYNSGVIYAKDTPRVHELYREWYRLWVSTKDSLDHPYDQPTLCQANTNLGHPVRELPGTWNCQFRASERYLPQARIIHYFANMSEHQDLFFPYVLQVIRRRGVDCPALQPFILQPRTRLYPLTAITEDQALAYFCSDLARVYYDMPSLYARFVPFVERLLRLVLRLRGIKL